MSALSPSDIAYQKSHIQDDQRPGMIACYTICLVIMYTAVLLRYTSRRIAGTNLGWDDGWILIALVPFILNFIERANALTYEGLWNALHNLQFHFSPPWSRKTYYFGYRHEEFDCGKPEKFPFLVCQTYWQLLVILVSGLSTSKHLPAKYH